MGTSGTRLCGLRKFHLHASCKEPLGILLLSVPGPRSSSEAETATSVFLSRADMDRGSYGVSLGESGLISCADMHVRFLF